MNAVPNKNKPGNILFIKEVAKYFMDFLETDFHKRRLPRRSIKLRNNSNLLIGLNLQKYRSFNKRVLNLIVKGFDNKEPIQIKRGTYKTNLPKNLLNLIQLQITKITDAQIDSLIERIAEQIEKNGKLYIKEYDIALTTSVEKITELIQTEITHPFIEQIKNPLQNLNLGDESNIYLVEDDLTAVFSRLLEDQIVETLNLYMAKEPVSLKDELRKVFYPQAVRASLETFFDNLKVADLFLELFEMDRNKRILDKQEFYLYFGDIDYRNVKYPIFYIPFNLVRDQDIFNIEFEKRVYINKKAIAYIAQEHNKEKGSSGNLQSIATRIIYLSEKQSDFHQIIPIVLNELTHFFAVDKNIDFAGAEHKNAKGASVRISNNCYVCLFDNSDEAVVNDYEEILNGLNEDEGDLSAIFHKLVEEFIHNNPEPFNPEVETEWDNSDTPDRLVYTSPIPLNSEQRQILSAVTKNGCKYIVVEGPPGTGKSHTITAIVFDAILKDQSILVLSDKKEALDVVEDKITQTMNKVRFDKNFQNPILRLGKTGNTYTSILSNSSLVGIKDHYRAVNKDIVNMEKTIAKSQETLKEDIEAEIIAYDDISIQEIKENSELSAYFGDKDLTFDMLELLPLNGSVVEMEDLQTLTSQLKELLSSNKTVELFRLLGIDTNSLNSSNDLEKLLQILNGAINILETIRNRFPDKVNAADKFAKFNANDIPTIQRFVEEYLKLRRPIIGYWFNRKKLEELASQFKQSFIDSPFLIPHEHLEEMENIHEVYAFVNNMGDGIKKNICGAEVEGAITHHLDFDYVALIHKLLSNPNMVSVMQNLIASQGDIESIKRIHEKYPKTATKLGLRENKFVAAILNNVLELPEFEFDKQLRCLHLNQKITQDFSRIPQISYASQTRQIEELVTAQATHLLDGRVIDFSEYNKADARILRQIIKNKQQFPKNEFGKIKKAFPCILAGIRDYAEYIPLEAELFDLVIIDEASQVSIAQAFPALIRARKVLVLGDNKQFSNVKAALARSDTNRQYLNGLETSFKNNVSTEGIKLSRLSKFNIKTSILDFFGFISNYNIQLVKYFRGYKEIISYSQRFYAAHGQDRLQVMKIRSKPIDEVLKFAQVETDPSDELYPNTNKKEVEFIIEELKKLNELDNGTSVGIITPHTNQQKLLMEMISRTNEWDSYLDKLQLKIMTFDTCQGEERDIIFYSMVASPHSDKLWGVFIKDLTRIAMEEDGVIKAQRLNVGFSRAKECMYFVISKPLEDFSGSIGEALRHYQLTLEEAKKERSVTEVDPNSRMESEVMNWFYQTQFWQEHKGSIEFIPQFEIGKYLKQLDNRYTHPQYKVDFLLAYTDERHVEHKIIIEYDGFSEHFKDIGNANEFNYEYYYSEDDVYRQKVLEGYGYKFLRINKFNSGDNPVHTLDNRIQQLLRNRENANSHLTNIRQTIGDLQTGNQHECPKCKELRMLSDFEDPSLATGFARFCKSCKDNKRTSKSFKAKGLTHGIARRYQKAIEAYSVSIRLDPSDANSYHLRGLAYYRLGLHQKTIEDSNEAIRLDPSNAYAYFTRGLAYENLGQHEKATQDRKKYEKLRPK